MSQRIAYIRSESPQTQTIYIQALSSPNQNVQSQIVRRGIQVPVQQVQQAPQVVYVEDVKLKELLMELQTKCQNYERGIQELLNENEKLRHLPAKIEYIEDISQITAYETKLQLLINEVEKLTRVTQEKSQEVESLTMRLYDAENIANQRAIEADQWRQRSQELEIKYQNFEQQYNSRLQLLQQRLQQAQIDNEQLNNTLKQIKMHNEDLTHRVQTIHFEKEQLVPQVEEKKRIAASVNEFHDLVKSISSQSSIQNVSDPNLQIQNLRVEYQRLNERLKQSIDDNKALNDRLNEYRNQFSEYESQFSFLKSENARIRQSLDENNKVLNDKQIEYRKQINEYENQVSYLKVDNERLRQTLDDNRVLNDRLLEYRKQFAEYESQLSYLKSENERLRQNLGDNRVLNDRILEYRKQIAEQESKVYFLQTENDRLRISYEENARVLNDRSIEYRKQFSDYESQVSFFKSEIQRLTNNQDDQRRFTEQLAYKQKEIDEWKQKCYTLEGRLNEYIQQQMHFQLLITESERLRDENKQLEAELSQWRYKYAEFSQYIEQNQNYLTLLVLCFAEIENLRNQAKLRDSQQAPIRQSQVKMALSNIEQQFRDSVKQSTTSSLTTQSNYIISQIKQSSFKQ